jgi:mRNA-degrading endonuclease toxin of MazEF toxin-antitoxin module
MRRADMRELYGRKFRGLDELVAPITSTIRGVPSQVVLGEDDGMRVPPCAVSLHNTITVLQGRLGKRVGRLCEASVFTAASLQT